MGITYLKELEESKELLGQNDPSYIGKLIIFLKKIFRIGRKINITKNKKIKILPYTMKELEKRKQWYQKQLKQEESIILSKNLFQNQKLNQGGKNITVWDGKKLFSYLVSETLEYICEKMGRPLEEMHVAILLGESSEENITIVKQVAKKVKSLSVVTRKMERFKKTEEELYKESGIAMKLSHNKRKSLKQEQLIFNLDVAEEEFLQYEVNRNAIVVHLKETIQGIPRGFLRNSNQSNGNRYSTTKFASGVFSKSSI